MWGWWSGACLAESGNDVVCVDKDEAKVRMLRRGKSPIYEPGIEDLLRRNKAEGRLTFTTDLAKAVRSPRSSSSPSARPRARTGRPTCSTSWAWPATSPRR